MRIDIMPGFILWALVTSAVVVLALWRSMLGLHDRGGLYIGRGEERDPEEEAEITKKIARIDRWGVMLTIASAALIMGIGLVWAYTKLVSA